MFEFLIGKRLPFLQLPGKVGVIKGVKFFELFLVVFFCHAIYITEKLGAVWQERGEKDVRLFVSPTNKRGLRKCKCEDLWEKSAVTMISAA